MTKARSKFSLKRSNEGHKANTRQMETRANHAYLHDWWVKICGMLNKLVVAKDNLLISTTATQWSSNDTVTTCSVA
jgi:hypothetical protein